VSALLPVIADRLSKATTREEKEAALLAIHVLDPACGSGHFLLAAARRLALELARIRAEDEEPSEELRQQCLRDVVAHCIYGVDKNPMAVELCKVALWIEAIEPGKPLSFLDAHIQCGDSLVGVFDPKVLEEGIPDEAYKQLTGDNKTVCTSLRRENAAARRTISRRGSNRGIQGSLVLSGAKPRSQGQQALLAIEAMPETTLAETAAKQVAYAQWIADRERDHETLAADLYTAAFFLTKTSESRGAVPTTGHLIKLLSSQPIEEEVEAAVVQAAQSFRFFHWHLRFGQDIHSDGFDCVLGNPPWERVALEDNEFFNKRDASIAAIKTTSARKRAIEDLGNHNPTLLSEYLYRKDASLRQSVFFQESGRYALGCAGRLNTYPLFTEFSLQILSERSLFGLVVPTGIAIDAPMEKFWRYLTDEKMLDSIIDFENKLEIFPGVHREQRFCLLTVAKHRPNTNHSIKVGFALTRAEELSSAIKIYDLDDSDLELVSPNTGQPLLSRTNADYGIAKKIYLGSVAIKPRKNKSIATCWVAMTSAAYSGEFVPSKDLVNPLELTCGQVISNGLTYSPVLEAKMIGQYDYSFATYEGATAHQMRNGDPLPISKETEKEIARPRPRFWILDQHVTAMYSHKSWKRDWIIGIRDVTNVNNERTAIAAVIPAQAAAQPLNLISCESPVIAAMVIGAINSIPLDFVARQRICGRHLNVTTFNQLPFPQQIKAEFEVEILNRVVALSVTHKDLLGFAKDLRALDSIHDWNCRKRETWKAELDAIYARLYGLNRDDLRYILDPADIMGDGYPSETFRVLKTNEIRQFGEYRTQRLVLEAWDRLFGGH
jgi:hypothetical protein